MYSYGIAIVCIQMITTQIQSYKLILKIYIAIYIGPNTTISTTTSVLLLLY